MNKRQAKVQGNKGRLPVSALSHRRNEYRPSISRLNVVSIGHGMDTTVSDMLYQLDQISASLVPVKRRRIPPSSSPPHAKDNREFLRKAGEIPKVARGEVPLMDGMLKNLHSQQTN